MGEEVSPGTARLKAELLAGGSVRLPEDFRLPFPKSRSTAGPGAGRPEVVFAFGGTRAKKPVTRDEGEFDLVQSEQGLEIHREGRIIIPRVEVLPTLLHAPFQAFVNIDDTCILGCAFCNVPRLPNHITKHLDDENIVSMILKASEAEGFQSVALTSGVPVEPGTTVARMAGLVRRIRAALPDAPIGVEPYATRPDQVDSLFEAGADEIKLNIESFDRDIFERVCPGRDFDHILHAINHAGEVFGRNRVCSNIIFGLGETDENVVYGVKVLANMGAVATLRALRLSDMNEGPLREALGPLEPVDADRMVRLALAQKEVLVDYGLTTRSFRTMCHSCLSCDIVPFWDV
jgi:molybdenum cofactor biosynthesis enzyme MoaA